jgi:DHA2 family metal-tetracycline-proton antiporter-like MFS transporter
MKKYPPLNPEESLQSITLPLSFIIFFSVLNGTMFHVAVPDISAEYRLMPSEVSWVMTAYILVFAVGSLIYGKLADIYSVRSLITIGLTLMNIGSLMGLFTKVYPMLIASRLVQSAGGSAIPALAMIVITRYFHAGVRGRVLGIIASIVILAAGLGPIIGGFISGTFHWRYLFLVSIATTIAIPVMRRLLPDEDGDRGSFDVSGASLISAGTASLLVFVTLGGIWFLIAGMIMLSWFSFHIRRIERPFVDYSLFLNRHYRNTVITTFLAIGTVFGMMFMVPIMLRELNGLSSNLIGLTMFPGAMSAVIIGALGGRLSDKRGSRFVFYIGAGLLITGFLLLSTFTGKGYRIIAVNLIVCYAGFSLLQSSLPHTTSIVLSKDQTGIGMGIYNLLFFISGALSSAFIGRLLDLKTPGFCVNPLITCVSGWVYSNIFMMLALVVAIATGLFYFTFRQKKYSAGNNCNGPDQSI